MLHKTSQNLQIANIWYVVDQKTTFVKVPVCLLESTSLQYSTNVIEFGMYLLDQKIN